MSEIPPKVAAAMVKAGAVDSRYGNPSLSELGRMAGMHATTVGKLLLRGEHIAPEKLTALAEALMVSPRELMEWCTGSAIEPYSPPAGSEILSGRERRAIDEMIRILIDNKENTSGDSNKGQKKTVDPKRADPRQKMTQARFDLAARAKPGLRDLDEGH